MAQASMADEQERRALGAELTSFNCRVAQPDDPPLFTKEPRPAMQPCHWRKMDLDRLLAKIGASLKLEAGGNRRTLRLANPGLSYGTTPTIWASIQWINPGEVATAHRHTAAALRFIMSGEGADTIVDGEQYTMNKGDLVLTPAWAWHDHEHKGSKPMIWLDVLDISLVRSLEATFFEGSEQPRQGLSHVPDYSFRAFGSGIMKPFRAVPQNTGSSLLAYKWQRARDALEAASSLDPDPYDDVLLEYLNPQTGGPALPTIGTALQMLRPNINCRPHRHTGSVVYYVMEGAGATTIDGKRYEWSAGDFLSLPSWALHHHENHTQENAILFQVNDIPALSKLGLYREQAA